MEITTVCKVKNTILSLKKIKSFIVKSVKYLFPSNIVRKLNLEIVFVNNKEIKRLNKLFLKKNSATDILCFKYDPYSLELIVSIEEVKKQSKKFNSTPEKELLFVLLHGILHFKGLDDNTEFKRKKMLNYGQKILSILEPKICSG